MDKNTRHLAVGLTVIFALSFLMRATFVKVIVEEDYFPHISISADAKEYIHLAQNLVTLKSYSDSSPRSRHLAIQRPPGYPLFLVPFEASGGAPVSVFWAQALIGSLIPLFAGVITYLFLGSVGYALAASLLCAVSAGGVFYSGQILADLLFATLFSFSFMMLTLGVVKERGYWVVAAGVGFGLAGLIKPILVFWPFFSLLVCYAMIKCKKTSIKKWTLAVFVIIQVAIMSTWALQNYKQEKMFTLSTISVRALREYLAVQVESLHKVGTDEDIEFYREVKRRKRELYQDYLKEIDDGARIKDLSSSYIKDSINTAASDPIATLTFYMRNMFENASGLFLIPGYFLRKPASLHWITDYLLILDFTAKNIAKLCYGLILFFLVFSLTIGRKFRSEEIDGLKYASYAFILTFIYFWVLSGVTYWTGPRIVFPAQFGIFISALVISKYFYSVKTHYIENSHK